MHDLSVQLVAPLPDDVGGVPQVREVIGIVDVLSPDEVSVADSVENGWDNLQVDDVHVVIALQRPQLLQLSFCLDLLQYQWVGAQEVLQNVEPGNANSGNGCSKNVVFRASAYGYLKDQSKPDFCLLSRFK